METRQKAGNPGHLQRKNLPVCLSLAQERERTIRQLPFLGHSCKTWVLVVVVVAQNALNEACITAVSF